MRPEDWIAVFEPHLIAQTERGPETSEAHLADHSKRVWDRAKRLCSDIGADPESMVAVSYLHDLGRHHGIVIHGPRSRELAAPILASEGFPEDKIPQVLDAIATHDYQTSPAKRTTPEARLLYDCDKMDAFGAVGIKRYVLYYWCSKAQSHTPRQIIAENLKVKWDSLHYEVSKKLARDDFDYIVSFFERLSLEEGYE